MSLEWLGQLPQGIQWSGLQSLDCLFCNVGTICVWMNYLQIAVFLPPPCRKQMLHCQGVYCWFIRAILIGFRSDVLVCLDHWIVSVLYLFWIDVICINLSIPHERLMPSAWLCLEPTCVVSIPSCHRIAYFGNGQVGSYSDVYFWSVGWHWKMHACTVPCFIILIHVYLLEILHLHDACWHWW